MSLMSFSDEYSDEEIARARHLLEQDQNYRGALRELRVRLGKTQEEIGAELGMTKQAVQKIEAPDANPTLSTLRQYAGAIGARVWHVVEADSGQSAPSSFPVSFDFHGVAQASEGDVASTSTAPVSLPLSMAVYSGGDA